MSDPMTNFQIEDVLSSIRRLVAESDKGAVPQAHADKPKSASGIGRLVLTPAQRIVEDEPPAVVRGLAEHDISAAERASIEATLAELEAAMAKPFGETTRRDKPEAAAAPVEIVFDEEEPADLSEMRSFDREAFTRNETTLQSVSDVELAQTAEDDVYGDALLSDADDDDRDDGLDDFLADEPLLTESGLDEDVLRHMIGEVIREELQGALGERITRNVRKLVRREIHRVLAAQDFD